MEILISRPFDQQARYGQLWLEETEKYDFSDEGVDVVECSELADELAWHEDEALDDDNYDEELCEWTEYVYQHDLMLPIEQS